MFGVALRHYFGELVFPLRYSRQHEVGFKIRICSSIQQLSAYVDQNLQQVQKYGYPILPECLIETTVPISKYHNDRAAPLTVYLHAIAYRCNYFYDEQMRYNVLSCLREYQLIHHRNEKLKKWINSFHDDFYSQIMQIDYFDIVDLIGWIFCFKNLQHPLNYLLFQRLNKRFINFEDMLNTKRIVGIIIKRIYQFSWHTCREYKNILTFLCYYVKDLGLLSNESKNLLEKVVFLNLHRLRYRKVPELISQHLEHGMVNEKYNFILQNLMNVFKYFDQFPLEYKEDLFIKITNKIKLNYFNIQPNLLLVSYNRLPKQDIQWFQERASEIFGSSILQKSVFYVNTKERQKIYTGKFLQKIYSQFLLQVEQENFTAVGMIQIYAGVIKLFLDLKPQCEQKILQKAKYIYTKYYSLYDQQTIWDNLSMANCVNLIQILFRCQIKIHQWDFIFKGTKQKSRLYFKKPAQTVFDQFYQVLHIHMSNQNKMLREVVTYLMFIVMTNDIFISSQNFAQLLFNFLHTVYEEEYSVPIRYIKRGLVNTKNEFIIDIYVKNSLHSKKLLKSLLKYFVQRQITFSQLLYLVTSLQKEDSSEENGILHPQILFLLDNFTPAIHSNSFLQFNIIMIRDLFQYNTYYYDQIKQFAIKSTIILLFKIQQQFYNYLQYFSQNQFFDVISKGIKLINKFPSKQYHHCFNKLRSIFIILNKKVVTNNILYFTRILQSQILLHFPTDIQVQVQLIYSQLASSLFPFNQIESILRLLKLHSMKKITLKQNYVYSLLSTVITMISNKSITAFKIMYIWQDMFPNQITQQISLKLSVHLLPFNSIKIDIYFANLSCNQTCILILTKALEYYKKISALDCSQIILILTRRDIYSKSIATRLLKDTFTIPITLQLIYYVEYYAKEPNICTNDPTMPSLTILEVFKEAENFIVNAFESKIQYDLTTMFVQYLFICAKYNRMAKKMFKIGLFAVNHIEFLYELIRNNNTVKVCGLDSKVLSLILVNYSRMVHHYVDLVQEEYKQDKYTDQEIQEALESQRKQEALKIFRNQQNQDKENKEGNKKTKQQQQQQDQQDVFSQYIYTKERIELNKFRLQQRIIQLVKHLQVYHYKLKEQNKQIHQILISKGALNNQIYQSVRVEYLFKQLKIGVFLKMEEEKERKQANESGLMEVRKNILQKSTGLKIYIIDPRVKDLNFLT